MTHEDKQLLLKDLCARLPYQPMCEFTDTEDDFCTATATLGYSFRDFIAGKILIKPYLRPLSSITEEEEKEYSNAHALDNCDELANIQKYGNKYIQLARTHAHDYLVSHHFDYRGLIKKGLALEAPEGMYKND